MDVKWTLYAFEEGLQRQFPGNRNVRPKIRQQLQRLRDNDWLRFEGSGVYELADQRNNWGRSPNFP